MGTGCGIDGGIGETPVHGLQPGIRAIGQISDLHRRGLEGKERHAIVDRVIGEVDEDINAVGADHGGQVVVGSGYDIPPVIGGGFEFHSVGIRVADAGIDKDFHLRAVVD